MAGVGPVDGVVVGLDMGGTAVNATVLDSGARFLVGTLIERPSRVLAGPDAAIQALEESFDGVLELTGTRRAQVRAVGLDTPGPASPDGVISSKGATNFSDAAWHGYDVRSALQDRLGLPVVYNNDGNAAALYAHDVFFGPRAKHTSSISVVVGTGLGGGVIVDGHIVSGAAGMAGELGHIQIPLQGLLQEGQDIPACNCGLTGDVESFASLTGIKKNLLPYWLTRFPGHELAKLPVDEAAKRVRSLGESGDPLARAIFTQQAEALGRIFTIAGAFSDPGAYFVGGGVVETSVDFREWFLSTVRANTVLHVEQAAVAQFVLVPELDMAGARGSAIAAADALAEARV
ncbi:MAG: ROK family protein [Mycobacteriales bacterium]